MPGMLFVQRSVIEPGVVKVWTTFACSAASNTALVPSPRKVLAKSVSPPRWLLAGVSGSDLSQSASSGRLDQVPAIAEGILEDGDGPVGLRAGLLDEADARGDVARVVLREVVGL